MDEAINQLIVTSVNLNILFFWITVRQKLFEDISLDLGNGDEDFRQYSDTLWN